MQCTSLESISGTALVSRDGRFLYASDAFLRDICRVCAAEMMNASCVPVENVCPDVKRCLDRSLRAFEHGVRTTETHIATPSGVGRAHADMVDIDHEHTHLHLIVSVYLTGIQPRRELIPDDLWREAAGDVGLHS